MDLSGARCVGRWWLFDSTDPLDHAEAAQICADCPVRIACLQVLHQERTAALAAYGGPTGTWAGRLLGGKHQPHKRPREHGTEKGYYQHTNRREEPCEPCRKAIRVAMDARLKPAVKGPSVVCGERVVGVIATSDNGAQETTKASRPRAIGAPTPARGLADRLETTDS